MEEIKKNTDAEETEETILQEEDIRDIEKRIKALEDKIDSMKKEDGSVEENETENTETDAEADLSDNETETEVTVEESAEEETTPVDVSDEESLSEEESELVITKEMMDALNGVEEVQEEPEKAVVEIEEDEDLQEEGAAEEDEVADVEEENEEAEETEEISNTVEEEAETDEEEAVEEIEEEAVEDDEETPEETSETEESAEESIEEETINDVPEEETVEETPVEEEIENEQLPEEIRTSIPDDDDLRSQIEDKLRDVEEQSNLLLEYLAAKMADSRDHAAMVYDNARHDMQNDVEDMRIRNGLPSESTYQEKTELGDEGSEVPVEETIDKLTVDSTESEEPKAELPEETQTEETVTQEGEGDTVTTEETTPAEEETGEATEENETVAEAEAEENKEETPSEESSSVEEAAEETATEAEKENETGSEEKTEEAVTREETETVTTGGEEQESTETPATSETEAGQQEEPTPSEDDGQKETPASSEEEKKEEETIEPEEPEKEPVKKSSDRLYKGIAIAAVLLALAVCAHFMLPDFQKNRKYQNAIQQMERGEYEEAYAILNDLVGYKDADRYHTYCEALEYYKQGELDQAISAFTSVSDLGQARQYISYITAEKMIQDSVAAEDYEKAAELYEQADSFADSKTMAEYCQGITAFLNGNSNAKDLLKKIAGNSAIKEVYSNNAADLVRYIDTGDDFNNDDPSSYDTLRELASNGTLVSRIPGTYIDYVRGLDYLENEQYFSAYSCFSNCQGMKDSDELAESCFQSRPISGILYRNASSGSVDITIYDTDDDKDMYVKIYDENDELIETLYIRDGESATAYFQGGTFRMAVAYGESDWWFGIEESFGNTGIYQRLLLTGSEEYYEFPSGSSYSLRFDVDDGNVNRRSSNYGDF